MRGEGVGKRDGSKRASHLSKMYAVGFGEQGQGRTREKKKDKENPRKLIIEV